MLLNRGIAGSFSSANDCFLVFNNTAPLAITGLNQPTVTCRGALNSTVGENAVWSFLLHPRAYNYDMHVDIASVSFVNSELTYINVTEWTHQLNYGLLVFVGNQTEPDGLQSAEASRSGVVSLSHVEVRNNSFDARYTEWWIETTRDGFGLIVADRLSDVTAFSSRFVGNRMWLNDGVFEVASDMFASNVARSMSALAIRNATGYSLVGCDFIDNHLEGYHEYAVDSTLLRAGAARR